MPKTSFFVFSTFWYFKMFISDFAGFRYFRFLQLVKKIMSYMSIIKNCECVCMMIRWVWLCDVYREYTFILSWKYVILSVVFEVMLFIVKMHHALCIRSVCTIHQLLIIKSYIMFFHVGQVFVYNYKIQICINT